MAEGSLLFRKDLSGRGLVAARLGWLLVVLPTLALAAVGFTLAFDDLSLVPDSILAALAQANIDPTFAVVVGLVLPLVFMTVIGSVMFWKRPADPMVLITSMMLITLMAAYTKSTFFAMTAVPELEWAVRAVFLIAFGLFALVFALFPSGRSVPAKAWMAAPLAATIVLALPELPRVLAMFPDVDFAEGLWRRELALLISINSFVLLCQVYRYRRVSTQVERLQAKWVTLPVVVVLAQILLIFVLSQPIFGFGAAWAGWAQLSLVPSALLLPVGVAAAILKYRLYDIERIVSRTVSYGLLTVLLFGLYAALVVALHQLLPMSSDLAVAGSTLGVAALANPMRKRIQRAVDLRFNRAHTDAARTLSEFTITLRTASDLNAVAGGLQSAVARTFQPEGLYVWVRSS